MPNVPIAAAAAAAAAARVTAPAITLSPPHPTRQTPSFSDEWGQ